MSIDVAKLKASRPILSVVGAYISLKKRGAEYVGLCPAHPDKTPSLWVSPAKGFAHCFSCDFNADVIEFVMHMEGVDFKEACARLGAQDDWKPKRPIPELAKPVERVTSKPPAGEPPPKMAIRGLGEPSRTWEYKDADGLTLGYVARYDVEGRKEIRCWTWGSRGGEAGWGCGHWNAPRPLYGLERLAARPSAPVLIVEGEKAADAAQVLLPAYVVVTWLGGAKAWKRAEWEPLRGRSALLWPDNDQPGIEAMNALAGILAAPKGLSCAVKVLDPSGMADGFDAADWTGTTDELIAWAKPRAKVFTVPAPQGAGEPPPIAPSSAPSPAEAGPPEAEFPPEASQSKPKRTRPRLAAVNGNTALVPEDDAEPLPAEMSEDHVADEFAKIQADDLRFVASRNLWLVWSDGYWKPDAKREVDRRVVEHCRAALYWQGAASLTPEGKRKLGSKVYAGHVRDLTMSDRRIAAESGDFDRDPFLLGVPGGVIDLKLGKLITSERSHGITRQTAVAPVSGRPESWLSFIGHICKGDDSLIAYIQRWCGYLICGDTSEECLLFCYGPTQRGKSKFVGAMREMLGGYAVTASMDTFTETRNERHSEELASLAGARMIVASETEAGRRWNEARIKALTGRDLIRARMLHENSFEFALGKIVIAGNHAPALRSVDDTFRRRLHILEFSNPVPAEQVDRQLDEKLRAEYPQILQWCIEGCLAWQDCGLGKPEQIADAVDKYLEAEDTLAEWIDGYTVSAPGERTESGPLYLSYKRWAEAAGEHPKSQKNFLHALTERGYERARTADKRYIKGLRLKDTPPAAAPYYAKD